VNHSYLSRLLAGIFLPATFFCLVFCPASAPAAAGEGLLDLEVDPESGAVLLALEHFPADFLYVPALQSGVGSNDLGLDRGLLEETRWVRFERYGNRVLLLEPNLEFRANTQNSFERQAVGEAFAQSVLAGFAIENPGDRLVRIDLSSLLISDITRISTLISELEQGTFELDPERSAVDTASIRNYPENTLIPVVLTLKGAEPGEFLQDVTPTADSLTVRVMHQFIKLPDPGYEPRQFHPRSGYFSLNFRDYAAALDEKLEQRLIFRHDLKNGQPLTYYVDSGTPEPIRSALLEGASWWAKAFEAAGFDQGFKVDILPDGVDPLDVRYNVIQWVHRSTRGWSYGSNVHDPRTGEIIKGHVSLGSLRVRQDQVIAEALTAPYTAENNRASAAQEMALARLRQLSAHEVGHTLGLDHNFSASFSGDASVMDYPHPDLYLDRDGKVRLDKAYSTGISPWDILAIRYGYSRFPEGEEAAGLEQILLQAETSGIAFMTDQDARVPGSAHPTAHLWDNGQDVLARLDELMAIRQAGLQNFSSSVIPDGMPLFEMERRLVPVYLLHRYQLEATAKLLGGLYYDYRLKGEKATPLQPVSASTQENALASLIKLLEPARLALPDNLRYLIPPPVSGYARDREFFPGATGATFDHLAPARAGAELVVRELLQPQRLARLAEQHVLDPELPGNEQVMTALLKASWEATPPRDAYLDAIQLDVEWVVLRGLMALSADNTASELARESGTATLIHLASLLESPALKGDSHAAVARVEIRKFLERQSAEQAETPDPAPPGSPIG
jgi:hypothetical protein